MSVFPNTQENVYSLDGREEQLTKVGQYLKAIRTQQGLSLQQVAKRTHIQSKQLRAIEAGNWMYLPEAIYVKGFLKRYAQSLGLDGVAIAKSLSVKPATVNPKWLQRSNFSTRDQKVGKSLVNWWAKLTPLV
ncbi:MAG: helix-turn-helix transcriptional regulator [Cyanobacteria bacterium P01_H01_bin.105]